MPRLSFPPRSVIDDIVRRIVSIANPGKVILFGSSARGEFGPESDIDVMVVKSGSDRELVDAEKAIYLGLAGVGVAVDVIVLSPAHFESSHRTFGYVAHEVAREGRLLYVAADRPADEAARWPLGSPHDWLERARSDLGLASLMGPDIPPDVLLEDLCYHAHQAAEKALKAALVSRGATFPFVHNLDRLIAAYEGSAGEFPESLREIRILTGYAGRTRYPGRLPRIADEDHDEAVRLARATVDWAEAVVESAARDGPYG